MATLVQDPRILLARIHMSPEAGVEVWKLWVGAKEHGYCCLWHSRCLVNASSSYSQNPLQQANVFFSLTRFIFIVFRLRLPLPVECHPNRPCPAPVLLHFQSLSSNNRTNAPGSWQSTVWILDTGCWMLESESWSLGPEASSRESAVGSCQLPGEMLLTFMALMEFYAPSPPSVRNPKTPTTVGCVRTLTRFQVTETAL